MLDLKVTHPGTPLGGDRHDDDDSDSDNEKEEEEEEEEEVEGEGKEDDSSDVLSRPRAKNEPSLVTKFEYTILIQKCTRALHPDYHRSTCQYHLKEDWRKDTEDSKAMGITLSQVHMSLLHLADIWCGDVPSEGPSIHRLHVVRDLHCYYDLLPVLPVLNSCASCASCTYLLTYLLSHLLRTHRDTDELIHASITRTDKGAYFDFLHLLILTIADEKNLHGGEDAGDGAGSEPMQRDWAWKPDISIKYNTELAGLGTGGDFNHHTGNRNDRKTTTNTEAAGAAGASTVTTSTVKTSTRKSGALLRRLEKMSRRTHWLTMTKRERERNWNKPSSHFAAREKAAKEAEKQAARSVSPSSQSCPHVVQDLNCCTVLLFV